MSVTLIGLSNAGKTTLVNCLTGRNLDDTVPTIGAEAYTFKRGGVEFTAWDVGGEERFQFLWPTYCQNTNAILYVLDVSSEQAIDESAQQLAGLLSNEATTGTPILICGNKIDLPTAIPKETVIDRLRLNEYEGRNIAYYPISAKETLNTDLVVKWLVNNA